MGGHDLHVTNMGGCGRRRLEAVAARCVVRAEDRVSRQEGHLEKLHLI